MKKALKNQNFASSAANPEKQNFQFTFTEALIPFLQIHNVSLGFTTYQIGKVFLVGRQPDAARLSIYERTFEQAMGLASSTDSQDLALGTKYEIVYFSNALRRMSPLQQERYDRVYIPQLCYTTADCNAHDLVFDKTHKLVFVNTLFSCLAAISDTDSFIPLWKPSFISRLAPEDRCHLNGLAYRDGKPRYVTAFAATDEKEGWRQHRKTGGLVIDIETDEVMCQGLSMPHSPRWYRDRLWLLNSGEGQLGYVDMEKKSFVSMTFCLGYARGLSFCGDFALIGLSKPRRSEAFQGLGLEEKLAEQKLKECAGLQLVDLRNGNGILALSMDGAIQEIYDVAFISNTRTPMLLGFRNEEIQRAVTFDEKLLACGLTQGRVDAKEVEVNRVSEKRKGKEKAEKSEKNKGKIDSKKSIEPKEEDEALLPTEQKEEKKVFTAKSKAVESEKTLLPDKKEANVHIETTSMWNKGLYCFWQEHKQSIVTGLSIVANVGLALALTAMQVQEENECHEDESTAGAMILRH